ncbi:MAG: hypothetical protein V7745_00155 [Pseudomonadales bacterium]
MRTLKACALSLALIPALSLAQSNNINCKEFAAEQLKEVKQEYYGALTRDEMALTLNVAERSCKALFDTVEEERAAIQTYQPSRGEKVHWWEEEGKAKPNIKKAQQSGGK